MRARPVLSLWVWLSLLLRAVGTLLGRPCTDFMASSLGELFSWKKPFNRRAVYPPLLLSTDRYPLEVQERFTLADMQAQL